MKTTIITTSLLIAGLMLATQCGTHGTTSGTGGSSGGSSGVGITGDVTTPASTDISLVGQSVSAGKGASAEESQPIVIAKAITDTPASSGTCKATLLDGTLLDTGVVENGKLSGLDISPSSLDSTKQVLLTVTVGDKTLTNLVDLTGKSAGETVSSGTTNTDSTLSVQQIFYQADSSSTPSNPSALASAIVAGTIQPLALFKVFKSAFENSSTAGSSDANTAYASLKKAFAAQMATGIPPSFSDMNSAFAGGSVLSEWKKQDPSLSSIDMSTAIGHIQNYIPAVAKTFQDSSTFSKYSQAGNTGWTACAQYFAKQTGSELLNGFKKPEVFRGYLGQNADAFNSGNSAAFDTMKKAGAARVLGELAGKFSGEAFSAGQYEALKKLIDSKSSSFDTLDSSKFAAMGEAFFNQIRAANTTTELNALKDNPAVFCGKLFDNPTAYTGSGAGTIFDNQYTSFIQNKDSFITAQGCSPNVSTSCPSGQTCSGGGFCVTTCTSNCGFMAPCSNNGQCATGYCGTSGYCSTATVQGATCGDPLSGALKINGTACSTNSECQSCNCSSGACISNIPSGSASFAGAYKKNSGGTCIFFLNIAGTSGSTNASFAPNDINNPQNNTMFGGCSVTGTSSPFSIPLCNVHNSTGADSTIRCDGLGGSTTLSLSGSTITGTCALGGALSGTCTIDHTKQ